MFELLAPVWLLFSKFKDITGEFLDLADSVLRTTPESPALASKKSVDALTNWGDTLVNFHFKNSEADCLKLYVALISLSADLKQSPAFKSIQMILEEGTTEEVLQMTGVLIADHLRKVADNVESEFTNNKKLQRNDKLFSFVKEFIETVLTMEESGSLIGMNNNLSMLK